MYIVYILQVMERNGKKYSFINGPYPRRRIYWVEKKIKTI